MYGSAHMYVPWNARMVMYPKNRIKPPAVSAQPSHQLSVRAVAAKPVWWPPIAIELVVEFIERNLRDCGCLIQRATSRNHSDLVGNVTSGAPCARVKFRCIL